MSAPTDRFQPPTNHDGWLPCDRCDEAKATVNYRDEYFCEDCYEKELIKTNPE